MAEATGAQADETKSSGFAPLNSRTKPACHPERSEGPHTGGLITLDIQSDSGFVGEIPHFVRDDMLRVMT